MKSCLHSTLTLSLLVSLTNIGNAFATPVPVGNPQPGVAPIGATVASLQLGSGIDTQYIDNSVRPEDDFFQYLNGLWLKSVEIPADRASSGSFLQLRDNTQTQLRAIIEAAAQHPNPTADPDAKKISDFYASFMDESQLEQRGLKPLAREMAQIAALKNVAQLPALIAHFNQIKVTAPYEVNVHQDAKDATKYVVDIGQSGLGMPDPDYYLKGNDAMLVQARAKYQAHIAKTLSLAGDTQAASHARQILALETKLAKMHWSKVENRDPVKAYNKMDFAKLARLAPAYDWKSYFSHTGIAGKVDYLVVSQPSYIRGVNAILKTTPLAVWKVYFQWHLIAGYAPYLSKAFLDENFFFRGTVLSGIPVNRPRWKRGVAVIESALGDSIGKLYVARHFPPERKARMGQMVQNLLAAYKESVESLDWMGAGTKKEAQDKLAKFMPKIGYPNNWREYSGLQVAKDDLIGNIMRSRVFEFQFAMNKLGKPVDRDGWIMTPQTVNAYYNPELNEIVFPAAILQAPFFNANADDAVNYGAIGAVIGHEISHGFDDEGSQYDGDGNLRDWWSTEDRKNFAAKTRVLVEQYNAFSPLPGYHVNGKLTLGENIADNSGLAIAYKAYKLSLGGKDAPVIDGLGGDQRFFLGFAQVWRSKTREQQVIVDIKTDPHAPDQFRVIGTLRNQPGFYGAFGVKEGSKMYLSPEKRVAIW